MFADKEYMGKAVSEAELEALNSTLNKYGSFNPLKMQWKSRNKKIFMNRDGNLYLYDVTHKDVLEELNKIRIPLWSGD